MIGRTYNSQKQKTQNAVWQEAVQEAEEENQHPTAEEFVDTVTSEIQKSCIEIHKDYVPVEVDERRDEIYFSKDKVLMMGQTNDTVWFETETDNPLVRNRLSEIMDSFDVNLGLVSSKEKENGIVRYEVKIPFITENERQENIRKNTLELAREMRKYADVDEDDIVGDCPRDDCDGEQYRDGMGSCGPKYKCTRFECGFQFVKDVL